MIMVNRHLISAKASPSMLTDTRPRIPRRGHPRSREAVDIFYSNLRLKPAKVAPQLFCALRSCRLEPWRGSPLKVWLHVHIESPKVDFLQMLAYCLYGPIPTFIISPEVSYGRCQPAY
jgi:hypothetical protein